jgi:hypothetical protein
MKVRSVVPWPKLVVSSNACALSRARGTRRGLTIAIGLLAVVGGTVPGALAQTIINGQGGRVNIVGGDLAILESQDVRKEINCSVTPDKPALGFDLRFHSGFSVTIPLKDLAGEENTLNILFRVVPMDHGAEPSYFLQRFNVPKIDEDAGGEAVLNGAFDVGEGNYHVDWLMRDRTESACSSFWDVEAALPAKDREIKLEIAAGRVEPTKAEQFVEEPPVSRAQSDALKIKILVNFAPQNYYSPTMRPQDTVALVSILRRLAREPQFQKFSLVAFNIQEQKVLYRQDADEKIDFPALGEALQGIKLGTVDTKRLQQKHGDTEFLTELIQREMGADDHPDALIFAGPKALLDASVPEETLKPLTGIDYPVFYLNYALNPQAVPWRDSIGRAIKVFRGTEYTISRPRDLYFSLSEIVARVVKLKHGKDAAVLSAPAAR